MSIAAVMIDDDPIPSRRPHETTSGVENGTRAAYAERFTVKVAGKVRFVAASDVDYFQSAANYVELHIGADRHLIREKLSAVETALDPTRFVRIHRRTIVNLSRVKEIEPWFSGDAIVTLVDGRKLRLSRNYRSAVERGLLPRPRRA
jgi:two-component system LytT family response regulator